METTNNRLDELEINTIAVREQFYVIAQVDTS